MRTLANSSDSVLLSQRLRTVTTTDVGVWGRMTAHQMLCHLTDSFLWASGQKAVSPVRGFLPRTALKSLVLYFPIQWPRNVPTRPELKQGRGGTPAADFPLDRDRLLDLLHQFVNDPNLARQKHVLFGSMSRKDWLRWGYLHTDHHLRQFGR